MIKWYDNAGVYVGYAAPVNGVIHYFTRNISGVITDNGVTKPVLFDTTCCSTGEVLAPIADLDITGGTPVFVDTGNLDPPDFVLRSTPIGSIDITNPSTSHSVEIVYANQYSKYAEAYNPRGWDVGFTPYLDPGNGILAPELLSIGGGIKSIQFEGTSYIGSGGAGTTPAVSSDTTIGIPTNIVIAPGATVTIRYKMEVQGSAFMNGISPVRARAYVFPRIFSQRFV